MAQRGLLIAMSGVDASGKSTQLDALVQHLRSQGAPPRKIWTRAGYTRRLEAGKRLARRLRGGGRGRGRKADRKQAGGRRVYPQRASSLGAPWKRRLWLATALLDLLWVYAVELRLARRRHPVVICDRFLWDAAVDLHVNFPDDRVERSWLWRLLRAATPRPDLSLFLLAPPEVSEERAARKDRNGREPRELLARRLARYREVAQRCDGDVLDARLPLEVLARAIRERVDGLRRGEAGPPQRRGSPRMRSAAMLR